MTRLFGAWVARETALLCLIDLILSFTLVYMMLGVLAAPGLLGQDTLPLLPLGAKLSGIGWRLAGINLAATLAATIIAVAVTIGLYRPEITHQPRLLPRNAIIAGCLAFPAAVLVSETFRVGLSGRYMLWLIAVLVVWVATVLCTRLLFAVAVRRQWFQRRILILGTGPRAAAAAAGLASRRGQFFEVAGLLDPADLATATPGSGPLAPQTLAARRLWAVMLASEPGVALPLDALLDCKLRGLRMMDDVTFWEQNLGRINLDQTDAARLVLADGFSSGALMRGIKRASDIAVALIILILTLPVMAATALAIRLDSKGPIFYRQCRVGLHGRNFTLLKFRSMAVDAEAAGAPRWAERKDPRVTRIGAFIRAVRIDELPQVFNVLRGEMSVVGPRPERPHFVAQLARAIPLYDQRAYVKPGITGWAQVNYPYGASVEDAREKLSYDLYYVKNRSVFLDLVILVATVRVILFREGAR
ncbi:MAG: TIGR03013 family PEP-CTERM/XrtA system glycosyltransferase [Rhodospirillales bacterium]|nr:TIGR03013 family PEP-CTERM/XrtA system glycosyltransferase [Rhodospirillales bacterium]